CLAGTRTFADHHPFREQELAEMLAEAAALDAAPITTAKDHLRLPAPTRARVQVFNIRLVFDDGAIDSLLAPIAASRAFATASSRHGRESGHPRPPAGRE